MVYFAHPISSFSMRSTFSSFFIQPQLTTLFLIIYALSFCGCSQNSPESFVEGIYTDILSDYRPGTPNEEQYYARYCSEDLQHWLREESAISTDRNEIFVIDWSLWISAQDWSRDIALKSVKREANAPKGLVWTTATLCNFGTDCPVQLVLKKHGRQWKIDDFGFPEGIKKNIQKAIQQEQLHASH